MGADVRMGHLGLFGVGAMGSALVRAFLSSGALEPSEITVYDPEEEKMQRMVEETGVGAVSDEASLCEASRALLLAVKPGRVLPLLERVSDHIRSDAVVISIAPGVSIPSIEALLPEGAGVIRAMPNTPLLVGKGMTALVRNDSLSEEDFASACELFRSVGSVVSVEEELMDAVTALSGSGPAYVCLFLEALVEGGVRVGLTREVAYELALRTLSGTASMLETSRLSPVELREMVSSPGGTTVAALHVLERAGIRGQVMDAIAAAATRARELSEE